MNEILIHISHGDNGDTAQIPTLGCLFSFLRACYWALERIIFVFVEIRGAPRIRQLQHIHKVPMREQSLCKCFENNLSPTVCLPSPSASCTLAYVAKLYFNYFVEPSPHSLKQAITKHITGSDVDCSVTNILATHQHPWLSWVMFLFLVMAARKASR